MIKDYMTAKQTAARFGYTNIRSFYNAVRLGTFPVPHIRVNREMLFNRKDLDKHEAGKKQKKVD